MSKHNLLPAVRQKFSSEEVALLKETYAKGLDETETKIFLKQAEAMNLNPFTKEIYGLKLGGRLVLMTSIEGRRKIAHNSGCYLGCTVEVFNRADSDMPFSAKAVVKKLVKGHVAEFEATVLFEEFSTGQGNWKEMPNVMISKVAESTALRMAFPQTDNLYDEAERAAVEKVQDEIHMDAMPDYESQTQDPAGLLAPPSDPGELMFDVGSYQEKPVKINQLPKTKLLEIVSYYKKNPPKGHEAECYRAVKAYLG